MAIREKIRKRLEERPLLARVLERPTEAFPIPILGGVAVPARMVKQNFVQPTVLEQVPSFAFGEAYGATAGSWYRVTYPKTLKGAVPVCVARARGGAITTKGIDRVSSITIPSIPAIPSIAIPSVTIQKVVIRTWHCRKCDVGYFTLVYRSCPECGSSNIEELTGADRYEKTGWYRSLWNAKKQLGDWSVAFNWMRDAIATVLAWLGYYLLGGNGVFVLADAMSSQVDQVQSAVQGAFNTAISNVQGAFNKAISNVQGAFNTAIGDVNAGIKRQIDFVTDRVNLRLNDLYAMWGIPSNMALTPVHTRNESDTGFEFQSFGKMTIHYIAIGSRL